MSRLTPPKSPVAYEKYQSKCKWSLYNLLYFRQDHSKRKLLSDRRRLSSYVVGDTNLKRSDMHNKFDKKRQGVHDKSDPHESNKKKIKVEEKCIDEKQINSYIATSETKYMESSSKFFKKSRKNFGNASKTYQKPNYEARSKLPSHLNSVNKSLIKLESAFTEGVSKKAHPKYRRGFGCRNINIMKYEEVNETNLVQMNNMVEAIVNQKFIAGNCRSRNEVSQKSKQLSEALQILNSNKELFSKLMKDPNSLLVKHFQDLRDSQVQKQQSVFSSEAKLSKPQTSSSNIEAGYDQNPKSSDEYLSEEKNAQLSADRIIVLKPGPRSMQSSSDKTCDNSTLQSYHNLGENKRSVRHQSFSFGNIKRKLKQAMGVSRKEKHFISIDGMKQRAPVDYQGSRDGGKENGVKISRRNVPIISMVDDGSKVQSSHVIGMLKGFKPIMGHETVSISEGRHRNSKLVFSEPKISKEIPKNLSEMVKCRNKDEQIFQEQTPKYWQRAITYPEYDFFPMCNVGGYRGNGVMQMRPLFYNSGQMAYGNNRRFIKEKKNWCSTLPERNIGPPHYNKKANCQLQDLNTKQGISKNLFDSTKVLEFYSSITGETCPVGRASDSDGTNNNSTKETDNIMHSPETSSSKVMLESDSLDTPSNLDIVCREVTGLLEGQTRSCNNKSTAIANMLQENEHFNLSNMANDLDRVHDSQFEDKQTTFQIEYFPSTLPSSEKDQSSPVSVIEQFIIDATSTSSTACEHVEQHNSASLKSPVRLEPDIPTSLNDYKSIREYVKAVLQDSTLNQCELLLMKCHAPNQLLEAVKAQANQLGGDCNCNLLIDCIKQSLLEVCCSHYFRCSPWVSSSIMPNVRPIPTDKFVIDEVTKRIDQCLHLQPSPRTLEQLVERDMAKSEVWLDNRSDVEDIVNEIVEGILEELVTKNHA